jgi:hypothetical protein
MADSEVALPKKFVPLNLPHAASILSFPLGLRSVPSILGAGRAQLMPAAACPPGRRKPPPHASAGHSGSLCIGAAKEGRTGTAPDSESDDPGEGEGRGQEKAMRMAAGTVLVLPQSAARTGGPKCAGS